MTSLFDFACSVLLSFAAGIAFDAVLIGTWSRRERNRRLADIRLDARLAHSTLMEAAHRERVEALFDAFQDRGLAAAEREEARAMLEQVSQNRDIYLAEIASLKKKNRSLLMQLERRAPRVARGITE